MSAPTTEKLIVRLEVVRLPYQCVMRVEQTINIPADEVVAFLDKLNDSFNENVNPPGQ